MPGSTAPSIGGAGTRSSVVADLPLRHEPRLDDVRPPPASARARRRRRVTEMIGVPTSAVAPSGTSRSATVPAYGLGSSTTALAVSISTMIWLTVICVARLDVPPDDVGLGQAFSDIRELELLEIWHAGPLSSRRCGRPRPGSGPGPGGSAPPAGTADTEWCRRRRAAPGPPGCRSTPARPARRSRRRCRRSPRPRARPRSGRSCGPKRRSSRCPAARASAGR